jgi:3-oxoacyl-[acyl-carrier-protein] synthase-3
MTFATKISGTGSAFPATRVTNSELADRLAGLNVETSDRWIRERTGIRERRYSKLDKAGESTSSLGAAAAVPALEMAGKAPSEIDQIIVATCSPDTMIPSSACWLQHKIGAHNAWAMDINAACSGFLFGLATACQFIESGQTRTALVVGSEVLHPYMNWKDRGSCILFGDAAGAAVLERVEQQNPSRILDWQLRSDGKFGELLFIPACSSDPSLQNGEPGKMVMNGREIFKIAVRTLTEFALTILRQNGFSIEDVDWFVPHQANARILEAVAARLGLPHEKVLINLDRYGNTSSATIPTALDEAVRDGRIKKGHLLLMDAFGAGFTYGALLVRW